MLEVVPEIFSCIKAVLHCSIVNRKVFTAYQASIWCGSGLGTRLWLSFPWVSEPHTSCTRAVLVCNNTVNLANVGNAIEHYTSRHHTDIVILVLATKQLGLVLDGTVIR